MAGQGLRQPLPAQASPAQAAAQAVEMVAAQPKVERVDRAVAATAVGQMETQVLPEQLTRAAAVAQAGINHLRIIKAKQAAAESSSSKCRPMFMLHFQAA